VTNIPHHLFFIIESISTATFFSIGVSTYHLSIMI